MAATIVRVKRRLEESPAEALVIHSKRPKVEGHDASSLFVFSGTVNDKENISNIISKEAVKIRERYKSKDVTAIRDRLRDSNPKNESRVKFIDVTRGLYREENDDSTVDCSLIDLHNLEQTEKDDQEYAYDLYFCQNNNLCIESENDLDRVHLVNSDFFSSYRDARNDDSDVDDNDPDEDSNDENNWRNEYPDTDDSINEEDMIRVVQNIDLGDDLSSDEDEENLVYNASNRNVINSEDVDRYGLSYAKYKAKVLTNPDPSLPNLIQYDDSNVGKEKKTSDDEEIEEDNFYYPKHDSDDLPSLVDSEDELSVKNSDESEFSDYG